jgi:hypothetical protein
VAFLHEPLTWNLPVGGVVLLVGVAAAQGRLRPRAVRAAQPRSV